MAHLYNWTNALHTSGDAEMMTKHLPEGPQVLWEILYYAL